MTDIPDPSPEQEPDRCDNSESNNSKEPPGLPKRRGNVKFIPGRFSPLSIPTQHAYFESIRPRLEIGIRNRMLIGGKTPIPVNSTCQTITIKDLLLIDKCRCGKLK